MSEEPEQQEAADADLTADAEQEALSTPEGVEGSQEATQPANAGESASERKARLQQELADTQAEVDAEQAERLKNADPDDLCPTCGQLPPPADPPVGAREIWCPTCNQKLADLPPGH